MKNLKFIFLIIILTSLLLPSVFLVSAEALPDDPTGHYYAICYPKGSPISMPFWGLVPCGGPEENPCHFCHLFVMFDAIIDFTLFYIVFPVATLLLVIGGVIFILAAEDQNRVAKGKAIMTSVIIGLVIIFSAWFLISTFMAAIGLSEWVGTGEGWYKINCPIVVRVRPVLPPDDPDQDPEEPVLPPDDPDQDPEEPERVITIFMATNPEGEAVKTDGALGGRTGARDFCNAHIPANLDCTPDSVQAFISLRFNDNIKEMPDNYGFPADQRIYWWHTTAGIKVSLADNWSSMLDEGPIISQVEATGVGGNVWTGTRYNGSVVGNPCGGWTRNAGGWSTLTGSGISKDQTWFQDGDPRGCDTNLFLRCIGICKPSL